MTHALMATDLPNRFHQGKVRDTYDLGDRLLMVASDRISAFDVVLPTRILGKGIVLTQLSRFWFERTRDLVSNHMVTIDLTALETVGEQELPELDGRAMIVRKAERIDVECVVRGYLAGSGWAEYGATGTLAGQPLPPGLRQADRLDEPRFSPAIKNDDGHDENVSVARLGSLVGAGLAGRLEEVSLALYGFAATFAAERDLILADTKFEFGFVDGELTLIDELLTPDSSRFWDAALYRPGGDQPSFDKQFVRDWLSRSGWNREPPAPELPAEVVAGTTERYHGAYERLTGEAFPARWIG